MVGVIQMNNRLLIIFVLLSSTACSNKGVYENIRANQRSECLKETPPPAYEECIERTEKPFEEYQRERDKILKTK